MATGPKKHKALDLNDLNGLVEENRRLNQELLKLQASLARMQEDLKQDFELGQRVYEKMLLAKAPPKTPTLDIASTLIPSKYLDGDFYDFFAPSPHHFDLVLGDVMGKGIPAALVATAVKTQLFRFAVPTERKQNHFAGVWSDDLLDPHEILERLHQSCIDQLIHLEYFTTIFYGRFDLSRRLFSFVDCGYMKPIHLSEGKIRYLNGQSSPPLGMVPETGYSSATISYKPGDLFIFYSNGTLDVIDLEQASRLPPEKLLAQVEKIALERELQDDLALVLIQITDEALPQAHIPHTAAFQKDLAQLEPLRDYVDRVCRHAPGDAEKLSCQMQLAINEIFCNIIEHGTADDTGKKVVIRAELGKDEIVFDIADQGVAYDPQLIAEPSLAGDRDGGYGWYLVKKIADKVSYTHKTSRDGWNHLTLEKGYIVEVKKMEIAHSYEGEVLVITPKINVLDAKEVNDFKETTMDIINNKNPAGIRNVILNLENLDFIDSSGLGSLLSIMRNLKSGEGQLKLAKMKKPVRTIFDLVSMSKAFDIFETLEEGLKSFK